jgi:Zn-dependent protease
MIKTNINLGKIWGIPIGLHSSWFLILVLLTYSLGTGYFQQEYPLFSLTATLLLGLATSLLLFASVLAHELGHSYIAIRNKIPVEGITLYIFGGLARIGKEPDSPGEEFRIAIAGPIVSIGLGLFFGGLWLLSQTVPVLGAPSYYLMRINLILAFFNLLPGFPLDGGRVLRALLWSWTGNLTLATRVAAISGRVVAFGFIGAGLMMMFFSQIINGVWLIFIGWFLFNAASRAYSQINLRESLSGGFVADVMGREYREVSRLMTLQQLVDQQASTKEPGSYFITDDGFLKGMITLRNISVIPQRSWRFVSVERVMVPMSRITNVAPETDLLTALQMMDAARLSQVPVLEEGKLVGVLTRDQIQNFVRTKS